MRMTTLPPTAPGYYWWTNLGEHTPTVMKVTKYDDRLYASDGEYEFEFDSSMEHAILHPADEDDVPIIHNEGIDYYFGTEFWAGPIELPELGGIFVEPDSF